MKKSIEQLRLQEAHETPGRFGMAEETQLTIDIQHRGRVLFVDDERVITDTLVTISSQCGYGAKGVYSAEQALALLEGWHPDLVVIDVLLPAMNGIDLAIRIKAEWPQCHISLFSGQTATADLLETAMKRGHTFGVLAKPVYPSGLLEIAGRLLGEQPISFQNEG